VTGTGKLLRRKAMKSHYLGKKSAKRKRSFRRQHDVDG
jgi:ribosomal protein L35